MSCGNSNQEVITFLIKKTKPKKKKTGKNPQRLQPKTTRKISYTLKKYQIKEIFPHAHESVRFVR